MYQEKKWKRERRDKIGSGGKRQESFCVAENEYLTLHKLNKFENMNLSEP